MSHTGLAVFDRTLEGTHQFINDVAEEIKIEDKNITFIGIKAVLHALRDRLPLEEAAQLGSHFPLLLAGFYYQGWKPAATPTKERSIEDFLAKVRSNLQDGDYPIEIEALTRGVFTVLTKWVDDGEINDVVNMFPQNMQALWQQSAVA